MWILLVLVGVIIALVTYLTITRYRHSKLDSYYDPDEIPTHDEAIRGEAAGMAYSAHHRGSIW